MVVKDKTVITKDNKISIKKMLSLQKRLNSELEKFQKYLVQSKDQNILDVLKEDFEKSEIISSIQQVNQQIIQLKNQYIQQMNAHKK